VLQDIVAIAVDAVTKPSFSDYFRFRSSLKVGLKLFVTSMKTF